MCLVRNQIWSSLRNSPSSETKLTLAVARRNHHFFRMAKSSVITWWWSPVQTQAFAQRWTVPVCPSRRGASSSLYQFLFFVCVSFAKKNCIILESNPQSSAWKFWEPLNHSTGWFVCDNHKIFHYCIINKRKSEEFKKIRFYIKKKSQVLRKIRLYQTK